MIKDDCRLNLLIVNEKYLYFTENIFSKSNKSETNFISKHPPTDCDGILGVPKVHVQHMYCLCG